MGSKSNRPNVGADTLCGRGLLGPRLNFLFRIQPSRSSHIGPSLTRSQPRLSGFRQLPASLDGVAFRGVAQLIAVASTGYAARTRIIPTAGMYYGPSLQAPNGPFWGRPRFRGRLRTWSKEVERFRSPFNHILAHSMAHEANAAFRRESDVLEAGRFRQRMDRGNEPFDAGRREVRSGGDRR